ncbi:MAG: 1-acyl-sn-glycerol-3-phosphate acyltransferase [Acidobacteria bacterium]|nr:MAG: 1-acyl-sn-glycerol-3-phosphate acyltransferase [Acidobacteriota bacterium]
MNSEITKTIWQTGEPFVRGYRAVQLLLGWVVRTAFLTTRRGLDKIPLEGPVILASNHPSYLDAPLVVASLHRPVFYLGKHTIFNNPFGAFFLKKLGGQIPVNREMGGNEDALQAGLRVLARGFALGICPEGTRSPDGRLMRARTGVAIFAFLTGTPVYPVAIDGTFQAWPVRRKFPRLFTPTEIIVGEPIRVTRDPRAADNPRLCRQLADEIMTRLGSLLNQPYEPGPVSR